MSFLIWSRSFKLHQQCKIICETLQISKMGLLEVNRLYNLKGLSRSLSNNILASHFNLSISDNSIRKYLDYLLDVYQKKKWSENDYAKMIDVRSVINVLEERISIIENMQQLKDFVKEDDEIRNLAQEEEAIYKKQLNDLDLNLLNVIIDNMDNRWYPNTILEITAGVGGQESMIFVKDLADMYLAYADYLGIESEILDFDESCKNAFRHFTVLLKGTKAFEKFKYEGGVHRVQRVPETEKAGRMHTSVVSVAILPEPTDIDINLNDKDLKIEAMRASGPGGQHVNKTDSAVRIIHYPSGINVTSEVAKSQRRNKEIALSKLRARLYEIESNKQTGIMKEMRKKQMGLGVRNERIRTYNYNQDRVTDHRIENGTMNLRSFMEGGTALEELERRLQDNARKEILIHLIKKVENEVK